MRKAIIDIREFQRRVAKGHKPKVAVRLATGAMESAVDETRTISFVFSDNSVDRYGDTIDARGWMLENFNANPVALFGHDAGSVENVIGRAKNVRVQGDRLVGDIEFMEASVNPNAETVYQMVKGRFLKTVSVGFQPLDWVASKDKSRPGGVDFKKQELLEISIVPLPANPNALIQAKAAGIDVDRLNLTATRDGVAAVSKRGLYHVSALARLLSELGWLEDDVAYEAEYEGDASAVPQMLADAMKQLGAALIAMTVEEVGELLGEEDGADLPMIMVDDPVEMSAGQTAFRALARLARLGDAATPLLRKVSLDIEMTDQAKALFERLERAGKVLSSANEKSLRDAHTAIMQGCGVIKDVVDAATGDDGDVDDTQTAAARDAVEKASREERERKAKARKRKFALVSSAA